jgi:hypothetical protein
LGYVHLSSGKLGIRRGPNEFADEDHEPRDLTKDGFTKLFAVNVVTPHVLTALSKRANRLVYLSSGITQVAM